MSDIPWDLLKKYGVTSMEELEKELKVKLDIGLFTTPYKNLEVQDGSKRDSN